MRTKLLGVVTISFSALAAGCGVHQADTLTPSGPSTSGVALTITATPNSLSQNGADKSAVKVTLYDDVNRVAMSAESVRLDMLVDGTIVDVGTLSAKSLVTDSSGNANSIYTSPPAAPGATHSTVTIRASWIPSGNNAAKSTVPVTTDIQLLPVGVVLPPADTPTATFRVTTGTATTNSPVIFDASGSCGGALVNNSCPSTASAITSYTWNFGDGGTGSGPSPTHIYAVPNTYNVTMTVTNARGSSTTSAPISVAVGSVGAPTAEFQFSPSAPLISQTIFFSADQAKAAVGHTLVQYSWTFGDGTTGSGLATSHAYATAGSYNVILSVADDTGQKATVTHLISVSVNSVPTASFTFTPNSPVSGGAAGASVTFNGSGSSAATGSTIVSYQWDFGDSQTAVTSSPTTAHVYITAASTTYTVKLIVFDNLGRASTLSSLPIQITP